jgi:hypothetical protein
MIVGDGSLDGIDSHNICIWIFSLIHNFYLVFIQNIWHYIRYHLITVWHEGRILRISKHEQLIGTIDIPAIDCLFEGDRFIILTNEAIPPFDCPFQSK